MKIATLIRDHREPIDTKTLMKAIKFVGTDAYIHEEGIDDQYTMFIFSSNISRKIINWVINNKYILWYLLYDRITFDSFHDLINKLNKRIDSEEIDMEHYTTKTRDQ